MSRPKFSSCNSISVQVMLQHCLISSSFLLRPRKFCLNRGLLPLSLTSCCNFVLDVATWTFVFGMFFMSRPQYVMSRQHFSVCSIFSYRDLVFLVTTFCLFPVFVSRPIFPVVIGLFSVQLIFVSQPEDLYHDIKTPFKLEVCHNIDSPCCNQISSSIKHPLSRPKLLLHHLFCLNKIFHVVEVNVATEEGSVMTDILSSV